MKLRFSESKPFCFESFKQALTDTKKCKHLCVTNKRNRLETSYSLGTERIPLSKEEKDLGVLISHNLSWHNDIMAKVNIAMKKVLRLIKACQSRSVTARDLAGKQCRSEIKQCFKSYDYYLPFNRLNALVIRNKTGGEKRQKTFNEEC